MSNMHIVTASDDNYIPGVLVLIASAHRHNSGAKFTLLANDLSADSKSRVQQLALRLECDIQIIDISASKLQSFDVRRDHLTRATYSRLFIPELLTGRGRVIYMDCDMLVTGSLDGAWNAALEAHHLLAAVPCPSPSRPALDQLKLQSGDYFNGGFLVFDLDTWRRERVAERCLKNLESAVHGYLSEDESALNDVCRGRYFKLPSEYNFYASVMYQDALNTPGSIRNIHFVIAPKPWRGIAPLSALWDYEAEQISDLITRSHEPLRFRRKVSIWNGKRKQWMGRLAGRVKYRDSIAIKAYLDDHVVPSYITNGNMTQVSPPSPPFRKPG